MKRPTLYIAVTNHGFGHATRTAAVAATIQKLYPEVLLIMATTAPRWLLDCYIESDFIHRPRAFDLGVVQADSLQMDKAATQEKLLEIKKNQNSLVASEVNFLRQNRVDLILGDVPFLTPVIAKAAGIPCWMMSNFGWDLIYRDWGGEFVEIANWISECYSKSDRLLLLPFHEPMSAFPNITEIGLTGGNPRYTETEIRQTWGITAPKENTILLTFGGLGLQEIPYHNCLLFPEKQFLTFDKAAPDLPNLIKITDRIWRPVDIMPVCSQVVSKPGYGTFAEAAKLDIPITTITREDFAEAAYLIEGFADYSYHQIIKPADLFHTQWEFLTQPPQSPRKSTTLPKDGNETITNMVIEYLQTVK